MALISHASPEPLVSVVLPTRNRLEFLRRATASVLAQSERNLELLVVDDASTDGTAAYLSDLTARDDRVRVVRNSIAMGGAGARNQGIQQSRGAWVAFIDDDDEWMPAKLQRQLATLAANSAAVACSCSYVKHVRSGRSKRVPVPMQVSLQQLLATNHLGGASMCICSGRVLREIGGFDPKLRSAQDLDLWVRLRLRGEIVSCGETLVVLSVHEGPRISNNMQSLYEGARRFYFKHRRLMDKALRRHRLAYNCFIMSRQATRGLRYRYRHLLMCVHNSSGEYSLGYLRSSAPRLVRDACVRAFTSLSGSAL